MEADRSRAEPLIPRPALIAVAALMALALVLSPRLTRKMPDFAVYYTAASRAVDGAELYRADDGHFQFKYLPAFAVITTPVALLPLPLAKTVWLLISVTLVVTLITMSLAALPTLRRPQWLLVTAMVIAMGKFYAHEMALGQVNLLFAVLVVAAMLCLKADRDATAGAVLIAAVVVKPYAVLFLPWVVLTRGRRALVSTAIGTLCVLLAPVPIYGVGGTVALHRGWWTTVTVSTAPNLLNPDNVSLAALSAKWLGAGPAATVMSATLAGVLLAVAVLVIWRGRGIAHREALEGSLLLTMITLLSPQGWDYVFLVSTPAIAILANYEDRLPRVLRAVTWIAVLTIGLVIYDLVGRRSYRLFMAWSVITVCYFVVIAALAVLRARRAA